MPGVLMIETLAQVATVLLMHGDETNGRNGSQTPSGASTTRSSAVRSPPATAWRLEVPTLGAAPRRTLARPARGRRASATRSPPRPSCSWRSCRSGRLAAGPA